MELNEQFHAILTRYACEVDTQQSVRHVQSLMSLYRKVDVGIETVALHGRGQPLKKTSKNRRQV